jgi:hypothetical protein
MSSLICITSCNRINEVKKFIFPFIDFCNKHDEFDFLLSLDGNIEEYKSFCDKFKIPLLYSEEREGVGLSKNRVLSKFPNYDYYFFIEDDVELIDCSVFHNCINFSSSMNIPHVSFLVFGDSMINESKNGWQYKKGFKSGGVFNFFDAKALFKVGGWHTCFAKYKRFGHSEHSYRFYNNGFQEYPFYALNSFAKCLISHDPPHVTKIEDEEYAGHYHSSEKNLIESKLLYYPIQIISPFFFNGYGMHYNNTVADFLQTNKKKYPLTHGKERRIALSEYYFELFKIKSNWVHKIFYIFLSMINKPFCTPMKHYIKTKLKQ